LSCFTLAEPDERGITGSADALTDAQIAQLMPEIRRAAATLGARIPTKG
jgi:IclR family transcriptional regulator, acetate operon repressor